MKKQGESTNEINIGPQDKHVPEENEHENINNNETSINYVSIKK